MELPDPDDSDQTLNTGESEVGKATFRDGFMCMDLYKLITNMLKDDEMSILKLTSWKRAVFRPAAGPLSITERYL